jgi:hypothetical protein
LVDQSAPQAIPGGTSLSEAHLDQPGQAGEYLAGQLAAVFASHRPLYRLDDGRGDASVIFELLGAIPDLATGSPANVFVLGALVSILEPTPAADVVDEYGFETRRFALDIGQQLLQRIAPVDAQHAFAVVVIGPVRRRIRGGRHIAVWRRIGFWSSNADARSTCEHIVQRESTHPSPIRQCLGCWQDGRPMTSPVMSLF